jgi:hypothetical protein
MQRRVPVQRLAEPGVIDPDLDAGPFLLQEHGDA